jgi:site-specific DNA-cytosine methylase
LNVLSLFDGIGCGHVALERLGIHIDNYFASEIDEMAIKVTQNNYPGTIQLGDIINVKGKDLPKIDLLIGGSPCQDISNLKSNGKGLEGDKSSLFYEYLRLLQETNPKYFLLENVVGRKLATETITELLGVKPTLIDSRLVSGQKRKRYYWTNISGISQPQDKHILLQDILEPKVDENYFLKDGRLKWLMSESGQKCLEKHFASLDPKKSQCLTARSEASWNCNYVTQCGRIRKLTPIEYERLQTLPDNYTNTVPDNHRYRLLGNGWTVDVIAHILKEVGQS